MELIFAAALCSVLVSILLKVCKTRGFDTLQMIACNYISASLLAYFWFEPDFQHLSVIETPWWLIVALGLLLPGVFVALSQALQNAGILKTEIAQRLSVVWSLLAAFLIFQEQFNLFKLLGIALGIAGVLLILLGKTTQVIDHEAKYAAIRPLLVVWLGYALIDVLLKYTTSLGLQFSLALNLIFICAWLFASTYISLSKKHQWNHQSILAGLGLGIVNFANIALYVKAHMLFKATPALVFAGMNLLVVLLGVGAGLVFFKERLSLTSTFGLILGVAAIFCLTFAMSLPA
ncbi:DMT family transporter [Acinetobacter sp. GSS19]|uniref:DMT family transporter n=1 Tax=Acinetobacter sp. GSS19 TaxID=3020716 RepID=UPI0023604739|nr:DMT family transporter [Acinetobacter sp. GSS19]